MTLLNVPLAYVYIFIYIVRLSWYSIIYSGYIGFSTLFPLVFSLPLYTEKFTLRLLLWILCRPDRIEQVWELLSMPLVQAADNVLSVPVPSMERMGWEAAQVVLLRSADASGSLMFHPEVCKGQNKERLCLWLEEWKAIRVSLRVGMFSHLL